MLNDNISSDTSGAQMPLTQSTVAADNSTNVVTSPKNAAHSQSTIQQSELAALVAMLMAGVPLLQPPQNSQTVQSEAIDQASDARAKLFIKVETIKKDIIDHMWESFLKTVHELAERAKKDEQVHWAKQVESTGGPKSAAEYTAYLFSISAEQRAKEIAGNDPISSQFGALFNQWIISPIGQADIAGSTGKSGYPDPAFIAGALVVSESIVLDMIGDQSNRMGFQLSVSPLSDALFAAGPHSGLPGDYQAAAALVAALLYGGAMYKATAETVTQGGGKAEGKAKDINFAINYAKNILAIVMHNVEGEVPQNPEVSKQNGLIRLTLSAMALNMLYRASYGGMTGQELKSLLAGNTNDIHATIKPLIEQLVSLVNSYLGTDPKAREDMIASLMNYVDNKHSVDAMLETTHLYKSFLASRGELNHKLFEATTG